MYKWVYWVYKQLPNSDFKETTVKLFFNVIFNIDNFFLKINRKQAITLQLDGRIRNS